VLDAVAAARGIGPRALAVLMARGHVSATDLAAYFDAPAASLHDPLLLPDAASLRRRVQEAVARQERVLVFGDFDADGLTGSAILALTLRRLGLDVAVHVPDRVDEGHGLSRLSVERARAEHRGLIITVDTGTSSVAEVALAAEAGIDVIVTDHHHVPEQLPAAVALVNPHRPGSVYPDARLAGTGVAFKIAQLLLDAEIGGQGAALDLTDLAVVGTVADMAPIVGENRAIARLGLERIRSAPRPGIAGPARLGRTGPGCGDAGVDRLHDRAAPQCRRPDGRRDHRLGPAPGCDGRGRHSAGGTPGDGQRPAPVADRRGAGGGRRGCLGRDQGR
jgi:single-stranded-DNA-specific exonuclease